MATIAEWPKNAEVMADGFSIDRDALTARSEMESGPPKQFQIRTRGMVRRNVRVLMSSLANYQSFILWFKRDIRAGADWFWWVDPISKSKTEARIVSGITKEEQLAPGIRTHWVVTMTVESWDI